MRTLTTKSSISSADQPVTSFTSRLILAFVRKYRSHKTATALSALSDHELADIGIERTDIPTVSAYQAI